MTDRVTWSTSEGTWQRIGECQRCGQCCVIEGCPHYAVLDGLPTCTIWDRLDEPCELCSKDKWIEHKDGTRTKRWVNHSVCRTAPDHPGIYVVKQGICGFRFVKVEDNGNSA